jgi:CubicO group peptidase (beta-lactamase class C family)
LCRAETVFEDYPQSSAGEYHDVYSVTKSVVSTLVGIAIDEGLIAGVDETLGELLPAYAGDMTNEVAGTTLRQVLTMTGGFASESSASGFSFMRAPDPVAAVLSSPAAPPGGPFASSNAGAHVVSAVLVEATGMSLLDYARSRLFQPHGHRQRTGAGAGVLEARNRCVPRGGDGLAGRPSGPQPRLQ